MGMDACIDHKMCYEKHAGKKDSKAAPLRNANQKNVFDICNPQPKYSPIVSKLRIDSYKKRKKLRKYLKKVN